MKKINALTGIRGFAALWVVLCHMADDTLMPYLHFGFLRPFLSKGYLAVDLFFILSGLVIAYAHQAEFQRVDCRRSMRFYLLRLARIYPLHLFMLVLFLATVGLLVYIENYHLIAETEPYTRYTIKSFVINLLNIQAWQILPKNTWNYPAWSISAEWFAYLLFPFLIVPISRLKKAFYYIGLAVLMLCVLFGVAYTRHLTDMNWTHHLSILRVTTEFIMGCCLYNLLENDKLSPKLSNILAACVCTITIGAIAFQVSDILIIGLFAIFMYFLAHAQGWFEWIFSNRVSVFLGEISYSMYMVHAFVTLFLAGLLEPLIKPHVSNGVNLLLIAMWVAVTIDVGYLLYLFVENPARKRMRHWIDAHFRHTSLDPVH